MGIPCLILAHAAGRVSRERCGAQRGGLIGFRMFGANIPVRAEIDEDLFDRDHEARFSNERQGQSGLVLAGFVLRDGFS
jgi:hypothetical protein